MKKILLMLAAFALVASACNKAQTVTMSVGKVPATVEGNVVTIPVTISGIKIVKADGDTSGKSGHFHVFIDRTPVRVGKVIPKMPGIVHSAENPIKIYGLTPGMHKFHVVLGNGAHQRIDGKIRARLKVDVKGPGVQGSAPATLPKGQALVVQLKSEGVKIVEPGTESGTGEAHYHVIVDPASPPKAGEMISDSAMTSSASASPSSSPSGSAMPSGSPAAMMTSHMYMTGASSVSIPGLSAGEHIIWVVLADKDHKAFDPPVIDKLTVTVS